MTYGISSGIPQGAYFLVVDGDLPDWIQKTFRMTPGGNFKGGAPMGVVGVIREGMQIPADLDFAVIIYHDSQYHQKLAGDLITQIRSVSSSHCIVIGVPVDADTAETNAPDYAQMYYSYTP